MKDNQSIQIECVYDYLSYVCGHCASLLTTCIFNLI